MTSWSNAKAIHQAQQREKEIENVRDKFGLAEAVNRLNLTGPELEAVTRRQEIDDQWFRLIPASQKRKVHSGERKMLYSVLTPVETIESLVGGTFRQDTDRTHKHQGVAVATDKRVIFLDKGIFGSTETMEIAYRNVESVTHSTGMIAAGVQVIGRGGSSYRIEDIISKETAPAFVAVIRARIIEG